MINLPNALTVLRIFFVPLLLALMLHSNLKIEIADIEFNNEWLALVIFLTAAATDLLDGYLARRRRQVTTFGKLADPLADKLLISAAFICLVELNRIPAWMAFIVIGREFAVTGLRGIALSKGCIISASDLGRTKMILQVVAVSLLMVEPYYPEVGSAAYLALWFVILFAGWSAIDYCHKFWVQFGVNTSKDAPQNTRTFHKSSENDLAP